MFNFDIQARIDQAVRDMAWAFADDAFRVLFYVVVGVTVAHMLRGLYHALRTR